MFLFIISIQKEQLLQSSINILTLMGAIYYLVNNSSGRQIHTRLNAIKSIPQTEFVLFVLWSFSKLIDTDNLHTYQKRSLMCVWQLFNFGRFYYSSVFQQTFVKNLSKMFLD